MPREYPLAPLLMALLIQSLQDLRLADGAFGAPPEKPPAPNRLDDWNGAAAYRWLMNDKPSVDGITVWDVADVLGFNLNGIRDGVRRELKAEVSYAA